MAELKRNMWVAICVIFLLLSVLPGCSGNADIENAENDNDFEQVRVYIDAWLAELNIDSIMVSTSFVMDSIIDRWREVEGSYQIVSLRHPDHYDSIGHIAYSINIPWVYIVNEENLARLNPEKQQILYCYYGHGSMICASILSLMGYDCQSMKFGMMDWNLGSLVKEPLAEDADNPLESEMQEANAIYPHPVITCEHEKNEEIIRELALRYFFGDGSPVIRKAALIKILDNWDSLGAEYHIVDLRSSDDYSAGHIPHAINIPWRDIARSENLAKLDFNRTVITYSETGQVGQMSSTLLNLLGYKAVNFRFGMLNWNAEKVDSSMHWDGQAEYPVEL